MNEKRKPRKRKVSATKNPPKPNRTGKALHVYLRPKLRDTLTVLVRRDRRSLTTEVSIAIEQYLTEKGLWPPEDEESE